MISVATYQVSCDEPGCRESSNFIADTNGALSGIYEVTTEVANAVYVFFGGEITAEGKHRCKACRERIHGKLESQTPKEINQQLDAITAAKTTLPALVSIVASARNYRAAEQDGTPRLWRGRELHELAVVLDDALEEFNGSGASQAD